MTMLAGDTNNTPDTNQMPVTITPHERLTWDEICLRYPDTWVVAVSPKRIDETDDADDVTIEFCTTVVVAHHRNRKSLTPFIKAEQQRYEDLGTYFTGRLIPPAYELVVR
jgi:hypothetical protein